MPVSTSDQQKYYAILDLHVGASEDDIRAAYKKLALKWHPDRHDADKDDAQEKFIEISNAYNSLLDVIHNPRKNRRRDKNKKKKDANVPPPTPPSSKASSDSSSRHSSSASSSNPMEERKRKDPRERSEGKPFRQRDPTPKASSSPSSRKPSVRSKAHSPRTTFFPHLRPESSSDESEDDRVHQHGGAYRVKKPRQDADDEYEFVDYGTPLQPLRSPKSDSDKSKDWIFPLPLSLEDLCIGASHRYRVTRTLRSGQTQNMKIDIKVSPGWRKGTRIRVSNVGNERSDGTFQDIVFVVEEQPHPRFTRVHNDLHVTVQVPWADSSSRPYSWSSADSDLNEEPGRISEEVAFVKGLDGQEFALPIPRSLVEGADGSRIVGAGMPIRSHGRVDGRGDLVVRWEFVFPEAEKDQPSRWQTLTKVMKWK